MNKDRIVAFVKAEVWGIGRHTEFFHGGAPGLNVGDKLLPGTEVGNANSNRGQWRGPRAGLPQVYVTPDRGLAWRYAVHYPERRGVIYRVRPAVDVRIIEGQSVLLDYLLSKGHEREAIATRLRIPCLGSSTFVCSHAEIVDIIGEPWRASEADWYAAKKLPRRANDQDLIAQGMIRAGVPGSFVKKFRRDDSWLSIVQALGAPQRIRMAERMREGRRQLRADQ